MDVNELFDYDTTTITPEEAEMWEELAAASTTCLAIEQRLTMCLGTEDLPSLIIVLTAGLASLESAGRIKK